MNNSIRPLATELFRLLHIDEPLPRLDPVTTFAYQPNLAAFTPQERKWMEEAKEKEKEKEV